MSDTSNIFDLPTDPAGGGNNIKISATENMQSSSQNQIQQGHVSLDQTTINQIVSGLQQASVTGATQLPSRDIPQMTSQITQDPQIKPNYIPQVNNNDYINDETNANDILKENMRRQNRDSNLDVMYEELQIPILLAILFFMFQLPVFRTYLFKFLPSLFNKDGNPNLSGYVVNSILFALLYYIIKNMLRYFTTI